jgi:Protein of unknown function (DUF1826)
MKKLQAVSGQAHWAISDDPAGLAGIYEDQVTISIWQRRLAPEVEAYVQALLASSHKVSVKLNATPEELKQELAKSFPIHPNQNPDINSQALLDDLNQLVEMFSCLFELEHLGLRIHTLESSMCPRFHVDHVPVRMVTTYGGPGTQWLPAAYASCVKLGPNATGVVDKELDCTVIQQLQAGDLALLKGENWEGNEGRGLIHRSPSCVDSTKQKTLRRLLVTCDFGS